jgi:hypothetical protein
METQVQTMETTHALILIQNSNHGGRLSYQFQSTFQKLRSQTDKIAAVKDSQTTESILVITLIILRTDTAIHISYLETRLLSVVSKVSTLLSS